MSVDSFVCEEEETHECVADLPTAVASSLDKPWRRGAAEGDTESERSAARTFERLSSRVSSTSVDDDLELGDRDLQRQDAEDVDSPPRACSSFSGQRKEATNRQQHRAGFEGAISFLNAW